MQSFRGGKEPQRASVGYLLNVHTQQMHHSLSLSFFLYHSRIHGLSFITHRGL